MVNEINNSLTEKPTGGYFNLNDNFFEKIKQEDEIDSPVYGTGEQLVLSIPSGFANAYNIKKGDIFTFEINGNNYSLFYNENASEEIKKNCGKWRSINEEKNSENKSKKIFNTRVQKTGRHLTIAIPKKFKEDVGIQKKDIFSFKISNKKVIYNQKKTNETREFNKLDDQEKVQKIWGKHMPLDLIDRTILYSMSDLKWGVTTAEIAKTIKIHPATVKNRLIKLCKKGLIEEIKSEDKGMFRYLLREKFDEIFKKT